MSWLGFVVAGLDFTFQAWGPGCEVFVQRLKVLWLGCKFVGLVFEV